MTHNFKILFLAGLWLFAPAALAEKEEKPHVYCFTVNFSNPGGIQSATIKGYDRPWYKLSQPRVVHNATFTDFRGKHCWRSELPEMGLSMSYAVKEGPGINRSYRCRVAPLPMEKYEAKTWRVTIKKKAADETYPIDCQIK